MFWIRTLILLILVTFAFGQESGAVIANYNEDRGEPINIRTDESFGSEAVLIRFFDDSNENTMLINTGYSVEVRLSQTETALCITGEVLGNYLFVYTKTIFYWADSVDGVAGTEINGRGGTPLEILMIHYNTKYASYFEALKHNDGLIILHILMPVKAGKDNKKFKPFAEKCKEIEESGKSTEIKLMEHNSWYLELSESKYFAYPGSLKNASTETTYNCSISVVLEQDGSDEIFISQKQFEETFLKMKNSDREPINTAQKAQGQGDRPVISSIGQSFTTSISENSEKFYSTDGYPDP